MSARRLALHALERIDHDGAFANLLVPRLLDESLLEGRDRAFVTELVYGTVRMRRACDAIVDRFITHEPSPDIRSLLRLGAYQLELGGVAKHAAVSETVELAPPKVRGFVNAVLRRVAATPMVWPDDATRLSYPDWVVERLTVELGHDDAMTALVRMNEPAPVTRRDDGYVQDTSSQWVAALVGAQHGERVLDIAAAPGGKATALAHDGAFVVAADLQPHRARLVARNASAVGVADRLAAVVADGAATPLPDGAVDRVLLDAPCSGLGALRRRPDARWRLAPGDIDALAALQRRLLDEARRVVRPGGVVVYSVCTLTAAESIDLDTFGWPALEPPGPPWRSYGRGARLLPHDADTDGMTVLRWRRPG